MILTLHFYLFRFFLLFNSLHMCHDFNVTFLAFSIFSSFVATYISIFDIAGERAWQGTRGWGPSGRSARSAADCAGPPRFTRRYEARRRRRAQRRRSARCLLPRRGSSTIGHRIDIAPPLRVSRSSRRPRSTATSGDPIAAFGPVLGVGRAGARTPFLRPLRVALASCMCARCVSAVASRERAPCSRPRPPIHPESCM